MGWTGVFLGALVGLGLTRTVWGAVCGALIGYFLEQGARQRPPSAAERMGAGISVRAEFMSATFHIMGHVAKSDGRVSEAEIAAARQLMEEFRLDERDTQAAINCFGAGKAPGFAPAVAVERLRVACAGRSDLLRHFMDLQLRAAFFGNGIAPPARGKLLRIAEHLGFSGLEFAYMEASVRASQARSRQRGAETRPGTSLAECYAELEVDANISDQELTKAYRRQMSRHHPDKLVANGLPESMAQMAKEKTQRIQEAYEGIRAARGMR